MSASMPVKDDAKQKGEFNCLKSDVYVEFPSFATDDLLKILFTRVR